MHELNGLTLGLLILLVTSISLFIHYKCLTKMYKKIKYLLHNETNKRKIRNKIDIYFIIPSINAFIMVFFTLATSLLLADNKAINNTYFEVSAYIALFIFISVEIIILINAIKIDKKFKLVHPGFKWHIVSYFVPAIILYSIWNLFNAVVAIFTYIIKYVF